MPYEKLEYQIHDNGCEQYTDSNGLFHNPKGWAVKSRLGTKTWYNHGMRHREDGPAIEGHNGKVYFYLNDKLTTREEWEHDMIGKAIERLPKCFFVQSVDVQNDGNHKSITIEVLL